MYTIELELLIHENPHIVQHFNGIFHVEGKLPTYIKYPSSYIFNTGNCWVAVYIDEFQHGEYLDCYGLPPPYKIFLFIQHATTQWKYNKVRIQGESTDYSAQHTLLFLNHRSSGQDFNSYINKFSDCSKEENDLRINNLFTRSFSKSKINSVKLVVEKMKMLCNEMENKTVWK